MTIETRNQQGVSIISPVGNLTDGADHSNLCEAASEALDAGIRNILVDLGGVSTIDSSGIGELVSCNKAAVNRNGVLKLCNIPAPLSHIIHSLQIASVIEIYTSEREAIRSF